jgi:hypothetical protein
LVGRETTAENCRPSGHCFGLAAHLVLELRRGQDCGKQFYFLSRKYFEFQSIADNGVFLGQKMALGTDPAPAGPLILTTASVWPLAECHLFSVDSVQMLEPRVEFFATVRRSRARNHSRGWRACPERNEGATPFAARNPRNQVNINRAPAGARRVGARRNRSICNFSVRAPSSRTKGIAGSAAPFSRRCRGAFLFPMLSGGCGP